jgi:hypothetical protein
LNVKRALAYVVAASLFAVSFAVNAKGGKGGGRGCSTGHSSAAHAGHSRGGSTAFFGFFGMRSGGYGGYGAGYVRQDGTYIEAPRQDCPADQVCDPAASRPAPQL